MGYLDETLWSRFEQPHLSSWVADQVLRLVEHQPKPDEPLKALACYGLLVRSCPQKPDHWQEAVWLRFTETHPISAITLEFLDWCCAKLQAQGKRVWVLVWDNASWHIRKSVRQWIAAHNRQVKESGQGVRIWVCPLPTKAPWLNPIEPKWVHGKRRVVEPDCILSPQELEDRVFAALDATPEPHLVLSQNVA